MAEGQQIPGYTAADIERYWEGKLDAAEMHAMEKAALEDPFLADAMEGYASAGLSVQADLAELRSRLALRDHESRVVPMIPRTNRYGWLKIAAVAVIVLGAALVVYRIDFNKDDQSIAMESTVKEDTTLNAEIRSDESRGRGTADKVDTTSADGTAGKNPNPGAAGSSPDAGSALSAESPANAVSPPGADSPTTSASPSETNLSPTTTSTSKAPSAKASSPPSPVPSRPGAIVAADEKARSKKELQSADGIKDDNIARQQESKKLSPAIANETEEFMARKKTVAKKDSAEQERRLMGSTAANRNAFGRNDVAAGIKVTQNTSQFATNTYRGRVLDANNNALPFANITNSQDNVGTYTDARGNFVLTSPDSVLDVRVRSLGFESQAVELKPGAQLTDNRIVLAEADNISPVVISRQKVNASRPRSTTMVLEEAEPVDGWTNYDTYLANNLQVPTADRARPQQSGEVELSFEVDRKGEPVNIAVVRSLCESCDKEAIRLLKDGPKWKRKAKAGRTSVTIAF